MKNLEQMIWQDIDQMPAGIFRKDAGGRYRLVNSLFCRLKGMAAEQFIGKTASELDLDDVVLAASGDEHHARIMQTGKAIEVEEEYVHPDGTKHFFRVVKTPLFNSEGLIVGSQGILFDITEQKQIEAKLREAQALHRSLVEQLPAGVFRKDKEGRYVFVNSWFCRFKGIKPDFYVGKTPEETEAAEIAMLGADLRGHPRLGGQGVRHHELIMRTGQSIEVEEEWSDLAGKKHWFHVVKTPVRDLSGNIIGSQGVMLDVSLLRQADMALQESQALYHSLVEQLPAGIFRKDIEGRYVFVNDWFCRLKGIKAGLYLGKMPNEVAADEMSVPEANANQIKRLFTQALDHHRQIINTGQTIEVEERGIGPDGREQFMHVIKSPIFGRDRKIIGSQGIMFDITERKRNEVLMQESRRMLRLVLDSIPVRVFWKDLTGCYLGCNSSFACDAGFPSPEAIVGKDDFAMSWKEQVELYRADDQKVISSGIPKLHYEELQSAPDGQQKWLRTSKIPLRDLEGNVMGILGLYEDITDRKRAEKRIQEQAALLDAASDAIYVRTLDHTVTYWNDGAEMLYGVVRAAALGRKITEVLGYDGRKSFEEAHAVLMKQGNWSGEMKFVDKAGKERIVFCRWTMLRDEKGQPAEVLAINTDITERKQLEANFLRAQRMEGIGALAGGIAHDLNNILQPILIVVPLLRNTISDPESRSLLDTVQTSVLRGTSIIKQLLTFARGTPGVRVPLPVRHLLNDMDKIICETFPRNIKSRLYAANDLWPVLGDATQIHQALMNLCVNARDAMPDGGILTLDAKNLTLDEASVAIMPEAKPGAYICISVSDTGTGISPENLERIFDPFFTTKEIGKGTGLGLATVLGIVRGHGGFVRVNSRIGEGTAFELYLPASPGERLVEKREDENLPPAMHGELILVVDDEASVRDVVQRTLEAHGYRVVIASEGGQAMALFDQHRATVAAVVTDLMMPGMDGLKLIRVLRQSEARLPILGMTGMSESADIESIQNLGVTVLMKPFVRRDLLTALHQAMNAAAKKG